MGSGCEPLECDARDAEQGSQQYLDPGRWTRPCKVLIGVSLKPLLRDESASLGPAFFFLFLHASHPAMLSG